MKVLVADKFEKVGIDGLKELGCTVLSEPDVKAEALPEVIRRLDRLTEPYMTTRVRGTGLGLAIVKKIVEEHMGEIAFLDRPGGGTHVRIAFDSERLAKLASESADAGNSKSDDEAEEIG